MKHFFKFMLLLVFSTMSINIFAQSADNEDEVIKIDQWNRNAYRPNEVIVHFKEDGAVQMRAPRKAKFQTTAVSAIDQLFATLGVDSVEELMPRTGTKPMPKKVRAYNGKDIEPKPLGKLYRLMLSPDKQQSVYQVIDTLKSLEEVDFAEPNYLVYTLALPYDDSIPTFDSATYVQEPLYSQQWGLEAINLPALWNKPKRTSKRPVIAILDTGVDIEHPDLAANIWANTIEANGIAGQDDDANGFKDDIHGWDFINNHSVTNDFNGHGTHCAGIAAAVGDNGIGITGANPDALIMPVTVMQSNGSGDVATIIKGIDYASANGADVISMSLGSYAYSIAEEQALGRAYANAVLVAAAGNDGHAMLPPTHCLYDAPMFPAAFSFVLGVEASVNAQGSLAVFSNYDETGPIYSSFDENKLYNYELRAPGVQIMSTFPGGRYKNLNGTSMACPLVAGAISRLIQCKEVLNQELLFGDLIHTRQNDIDIFATYNITNADRHPELALVSANMIDTINGDGDMNADAGETIEFYPILRNAWGQAENIRCWMKTGFYMKGDWVWEDTTLVQHLQDTAYFGKPLSNYAKAKALNPYRISINSDCADGREINMTFFAVCNNAIDTLRQTIIMSIANRVELSGLIEKDSTLYPEKHYYVSRLLGIPQGVTLTIKPGTKLFFGDGAGIRCQGTLIANGTPDSLIIFASSELHRHKGISGPCSFEYVKFENLYFEGSDYTVDFGFLGGGTNCIFQNCQALWPIRSGNYYKCNMFNLQGTQGLYDGGSLNYCNMVNNISISGSPNIAAYVWPVNAGKNNTFSNLIDVNDKEYYVSAQAGAAIRYINQPLSYYGSACKNILQNNIIDINHPYISYSLAEVNLDSVLKSPSPEAHGIVWKILVDGIDAQDEFELLPPIGVGQHKCDVYFNRPMDVSVAPIVSFGVRQPYTQHQVAENGSWSADSTIYTAYFTIDGKSVTDGLNTFYVYGAKDNEHFEIPDENVRFHMEVAAAGSMSTGLMAEAGLGKVTLTWETDEEDFTDLLGYNIYRWTDANDTTCINSALIDSQDTAFIDYNVIPGKDYYYVIRQMTTSLNSYDLSNPVVARPLTAIKGDANGSMSVDVADVITEVNYITHQNPQPFIFEAADVNSDNDVNIIDVVATIDIILHPQANTEALQESTAYYYIENGILYVESDAVLGGVQCTFEAEQGHTFTALDALNEFEKVGTWQAENNYLFMAYSMSGKTLGVGKNALLQIGDADLTDIILSDAQGHNVAAAPKISTALDGTTFVPAASKYLQEGNLFIKHGEHIYNVMGTLIK